MPLSTDIRIPRDLEPDWPDRCVRCGEPHPTRQARLWTHSIGWWSVLLLPWARPYTLKVPVCDRCIGPMRFNRLLRVLITWGVLIAGIGVALWLLKSYSGAMRKWLAISIAIICAVPWFMWETFFPPTIAVTCYSKTVDVEFQNAEYAYHFAECNEDAEVLD